MMFRLPARFLQTALILALAACGGGGSSNISTTPSSSIPPPPAATLSPVPSPAPAPGNPVILATPTVVEDGMSMGTPNLNWTNATASDGQGQPIGGVACGAPGASYSYVHLNIYQNGNLLSLPQDIGVVSPNYTLQKGCVYPAHTRDMSGKIRIDTSNVTTLGQFFAVWGQPLSRTNVAGLTDQPVKIYVNDGGNLVEYTDDPAALQLLPQREITIVVGTPLQQIPTYQWKNPPPLSKSPIMLWMDNTIGTAYSPDGDTASGGQGATTADGVLCEPSMSDNYHVHTHVAIIKDGQMLAIPKNIGILTNCFYDLHTHDATGVVHNESPSYKRFALGNFFSVWGQPLSTTNVAGFTGEPIAFYVNDGGDVWQYRGDPRDIHMVSHRSITIQIGATINEIPTYDWGSNLQ